MGGTKATPKRNQSVLLLKVFAFRLATLGPKIYSADFTCPILTGKFGTNFLYTAYIISLRWGFTMISCNFRSFWISQDSMQSNLSSFLQHFWLWIPLIAWSCLSSIFPFVIFWTHNMYLCIWLTSWIYFHSKCQMLLCGNFTWGPGKNTGYAVFFEPDGSISWYIP